MRKMARILSFTAATFSLVALASCAGAGMITGSGVIKTEPRTVAGFSSIQLQTSGNIFIEQTGEETLTIEAEDNIIPLLTSDVANGRLVLGSRPNTSYTTTKDITYHITVKALDQVVLTGSGNINVKPINTAAFNIEINGSGNVTVDQLDGLQQLSVNIGGSGDATVTAVTTQTVTVNISGSGDVKVAGQGDSQLISVRGSGNYNGEGLTTQSAQVNIAGSGSAVINAAQTLDVLIGGSGSVSYLGSPTINQQITGSGTVNKR
ncbi:MAG: DUF2807 domain-containing protein [Anaerolineae bacterium]|nr:DUF2807 domain-containing protein [Anaerolineae bacterium]